MPRGSRSAVWLGAPHRSTASIDTSGMLSVRERNPLARELSSRRQSRAPRLRAFPLCNDRPASESRFPALDRDRSESPRIFPLSSESYSRRRRVAVSPRSPKISRSLTPIAALSHVSSHLPTHASPRSRSRSIVANARRGFSRRFSRLPSQLVFARESRLLATAIASVSPSRFLFSFPAVIRAGCSVSLAFRCCQQVIPRETRTVVTHTHAHTHIHTHYARSTVSRCGVARRTTLRTSSRRCYCCVTGGPRVAGWLRSRETECME